MSLNSTVTAEEAAERLWDVVVIGAGPGGCMTARELARSGCHVLLLEAKKFPRPKVCGGCINHHAVELLRECGLGSLVPESGAVPLDEFRIQLPYWTPRYDLPRGWSLTRARFDSLLAQSAIDAGVSFLDEAMGRMDVAVDAESRTVHVERNGSSFPVRAKIVVSAEGLSRSSMRHTSEFDVRVANDAFVGAGVVVDADAVPATLKEQAPAGSVTMAVGRGGYVGVAQAEGGQYSLGAAIRPGVVKEEGSLGAAVVRLLRDSGLAHFPELVDLSWHGTPLLKSRPNRPSGSRVFLVGDAAGYVEPFTGEGMAWAIEGGLSLAPIARAGVDRWSDELQRQWNHVYRRRIHRSQWICRGFLQALHRPGLGRVTAAVFKRFPKAANRIIATINRPVRSSPCDREGSESQRNGFRE
jgi:menaquinone-9 beta-reductase